MTEDQITETSFDETWLCREFEEFDEKLPNVAQAVVSREIDWQALDADEEEANDAKGDEHRQDVFNSIFAILKEMVSCTSEMTAEEVDVAITSILTACHLIGMVEQGLIDEVDDGSYILNDVGREYYNMLADLGVFDEDSED